ncbi:hypothetical protein TNIN_210681, partial [Trichonephila inaurata madagascariensis]
TCDETPRTATAAIFPLPSGLLVRKCLLRLNEKYLAMDDVLFRRMRLIKKG